MAEAVIAAAVVATHLLAAGLGYSWGLADRRREARPQEGEKC